MTERLADVLRAVAEEVAWAQAEFHPFASPHEGWAVIREEVDELWEQIKANGGRSQEALTEARQVAAMAVRYIIDLADRGYDVSAAEKRAATGKVPR